jgi:3-dehydroquinate dehydratase-2
MQRVLGRTWAKFPCPLAPVPPPRLFSAEILRQSCFATQDSTPASRLQSRDDRNQLVHFSSLQGFDPGNSTMSRLVFLLNGPNLNLLGLREPHIYGSRTLDDIKSACAALAEDLGLEIDFRQTNREYELIDWVQEARGTAGGIVINPAGYSHTSVALLDALTAFEGPVIEVHISNIHKREDFRHHSYVSRRAEGVIAGCGVQGYELALRRLAVLFDAAS